MNTPLNNARHLHMVIKDRLLVAHPELADDQRALMDTLEGESPLPDALAAIIRSAFEDEMMETGVSVMIKDMQERKARFQARIATKRRLVCEAMQGVGLTSLVMPDFTASVRNSQPSVTGEADPALLPDHLVRIKREPNRTAIKDALKAGAVIEGYALSNGAPTLTVRTK